VPIEHTVHTCLQTPVPPPRVSRRAPRIFLRRNGRSTSSTKCRHWPHRVDTLPDVNKSSGSEFSTVSNWRWPANSNILLLQPSEPTFGNTRAHPGPVEANVKSDYVFLCGVMWCKYGQQDAGSELMRAAHDEDPDLRALALAMLQEGCSRFHSSDAAMLSI
jgi:hypothetical protein